MFLEDLTSDDPNDWQPVIKLILGQTYIEHQILWIIEQYYI